MLRATGGINTHKGAIFTLGIICGALGRLPHEKWRFPADVLKQAADMTRDVEKELSGLTEESAQTAGQRIFVRCSVTGVRGQASAGFPTVLNCGLPVLEEGLTQGKTRDEAGAAALLAILSCTTDTNMISRGGIETEKEKRSQLSALLNDTPYPDRKTLLALDREYTAENLSPGGSADLLALCWLLHFLKEES
jgi:triphosphoribosyl-dephospho-CoA synthetase